MKAHFVRDWLARANVFFAKHGNLYGANSPLAGAVECVTLVVVDDEQRAVFRLNTVGIPSGYDDSRSSNSSPPFHVAPSSSDTNAVM